MLFEMIKLKFIFATLVITTFSYQASADNIQYIKDSVGIPVKISPEGKRAGYLSNGDELEVINTSGIYSQVITSDGRIVWIENQFLQKQPSLKSKLPILEEQVETLTSKLQDAESGQSQDLTALKESISQLTIENDKLKTDNESLTKTNLAQATQIDNLSLITDKDKQDFFIKWFTRGAMVAGAAFIVGLILPTLFRRKKSYWN